MVPTLATNGYSVALVGEALGEQEAADGAPFVGKAGFRLTRLIEWAGLDRSLFDIYNTVWCRPPANKLEGEPFETTATNHCRLHHWGRFVPRSRVVIPMGNVATNVFLGRKGILKIRGYVQDGPSGVYILPTVHPSFIQRGQSKWSAAFINDIQKGVELARLGTCPPEFTDYLLDPSPMVAYRYAQAYRVALQQDPNLKLAFDIETPGKNEDEDALDLDADAPDSSWFIWRIAFSYRGYTGMSVPWEPPYFPAIRLLLESSGPKVVWNAGFDVPRIGRSGVTSINGPIHDGMVAWHILHSDLPKKLEFVATFVCPWQRAWKHLSHAKPAYYNAVDADVEYRAMVAIEGELKHTGLWDVYQRDVLDLDPILVHMHNAGVPVDPAIREDRAIKLDNLLKDVKSQLETAVPHEARRIDHVFVNTPKDTTGLSQRPGNRDALFCPVCGLIKPRKEHFKTFKRKENPCAGQSPESRQVDVTEYYRLAEFTPSRDQLIRYHLHLNRPLPTVWDRKEQRRKVSFGEKQIKSLIGKYPTDPIYKLILEYRSLDKTAGTYIGRPA